MNFLNNFKKSWTLMWNKKLLLIILFDFLFLFLLFLLGGIIMNNVVNNLGVLQEKGAMLNSNELENTQESMASFLQQLEGLEDVVSSICLMVNLLLVGTFLLWCIFQGLNWMISDNIINKSKIKFKKFLKLNVISFLWLIIIIIFFKLFNTGLVEGLTEQEKFGAAIMLIIFFFIVFYFLSINYSLFLLSLKLKESIKKSFFIGVVKFYKILPVFLLIFLIFVLSSAVLSVLTSLFWGFGIIGLIIFFILISWSRFFILLSLE